MSLLDNRPQLAAEVNKVAEVAGYLWQKGWAERNGGNITVNVTDYVDEAIKSMPAISEVKQIGTTLPHLKGCYFYCKICREGRRRRHSSFTALPDRCSARRALPAYQGGLPGDRNGGRGLQQR